MLHTDKEIITDKEQTENRQRAEKPIVEAPVIMVLMEYQVELANNQGG